MFNFRFIWANRFFFRALESRQSSAAISKPNTNFRNRINLWLLWKANALNWMQVLIYVVMVSNESPNPIYSWNVRPQQQTNILLLVERKIKTIVISSFFKDILDLNLDEVRAKQYIPSTWYNCGHLSDWMQFFSWSILLV